MTFCVSGKNCEEIMQCFTLVIKYFTWKFLSNFPCKIVIKRKKKKTTPKNKTHKNNAQPKHTHTQRKKPQKKNKNNELNKKNKQTKTPQQNKQLLGKW